MKKIIKTVNTIKKLNNEWKNWQEICNYNKNSCELKVKKKGLFTFLSLDKLFYIHFLSLFFDSPQRKVTKRNGVWPVRNSLLGFTFSFCSHGG